METPPRSPNEILLSAEAARAALDRKARMEESGVVPPFQVSILTVDRSPQYLHATLRSFLESDPLAAILLPVNLAVGSSRADYVRPYEEMGIARVLPMTPEEEERMNTRPVPEGRRVHLRFNTNYHRALTVGLDPARDLLVLEDDIRFTRDWLRKLLDLIARHENLQHDLFALSLYSPLDTPADVEAGMMEAKFFYGTQGIFYPPEMRRRFAECLRETGVENFTRSCDLVLRNFCIDHERPLILLRNSLIQHEGEVTTGLSSDPARCHRSPTFLP